MKKFVPLKKQSKAAQQAYHSRQRAGWGCVNPAARVEKDRHQYDRKQAKALLRKSSPKEDFFVMIFSAIEPCENLFATPLSLTVPMTLLYQVDSLGKRWCLAESEE